jgi:hypothetical protein
MIHFFCAEFDHTSKQGGLLLSTTITKSQTSRYIFNREDIKKKEQ